MRAYNCLKRSGITKVGQVLQMSEDDLLAVRNFGEKSLVELRDSLLAHHFLPTVGQLEQAGMTNGFDHEIDSSSRFRRERRVRGVRRGWRRGRRRDG